MDNFILPNGMPSYRCFNKIDRKIMYYRIFFLVKKMSGNASKIDLEIFI